jgi:hypothetical protein
MPHTLIWGGMALFWLACLVGDLLPVEALWIGPSLMVFGVVLIERRKRTHKRAGRRPD